MRAARTLTLDSTVIVDLPEPVCGPGEVVCRVLASATCGSDVLGWYVARKLPAVLGHEPVGEVVEVGAGVTRVAPGDVVAIHHHAACGSCRVCAAGHETLCPQFRATRLDPGGFAEYVRLQPELVDELLPLDGLDPVAATCTEPLACAIRAQDRVGLSRGDVLLVVGAGASGLLHIAAALAHGVDRVLVSEPRPDRRERAVAWGAEALDAPDAGGAGGSFEAPDAGGGGRSSPADRDFSAGGSFEAPDAGGGGRASPADGDPSAGGLPTAAAAAPAARAAAPARSGAADVAIVTSHHPPANASAAAALGPGGRLCAYAPPDPGAPIAIDGAEVFLRELTVTASWSAGAADMRVALALLQAGAVRTDELITHRFPLEETGAALAAQREGRALKAVVVP
jgi:threonine dehydrogenase-like Zn-dependent dehydrogenase